MKLSFRFTLPGFQAFTLGILPLEMRDLSLFFALIPILFAQSSNLQAQPAAQPPGLSGETIYKNKCASCHGKSGEGVPDKFPHVLEGDRSVAQLAKLIAKTMPEDKPGTCIGEESEKVAEYIHDAFYSTIARERIKPARIALSRLTVKQYRNAVTDLVGSFRWQPRLDEIRGLKGEYFDDRNFRREKRKEERTDAEVDFHWDVKSPLEGKIDPKQFAIQWHGSVHAPETGLYDIVLGTDQAARLFFNQMDKPLIDAWVKSGNDTQYKGSIYLLAGRTYPIRLEFSKATQGVNDQKKEAARPIAKAFVSLQWKPPHGPQQVIPSRFLSPNPAPERFVVTSAFPPDDRSLGWERGTAVTREWDEATTDAAIETANYLVKNINGLAATKDNAPDRLKKLKDWARTFAERAFRHPLSPEEIRVYIDRPFESTKDPEASIRKVALLVLKSPRFLYRETQSDSDNFAVASRLSFGLWDSIPDQDLLQDAKAGKLSQPAQLTRQIERMLVDPRAKSKLREFLLTWLKADSNAEVSKDPKKFVGFDEFMVADLRTSLELMLEETLWSPNGDFRQLLLSPSLQMNDRMAQFYGVTLPPGKGFRKFTSEGERFGVLTHPYLLSALAYTRESSPIHRGVFLARGVLGLGLKPPPEAVAPTSPELQPELTTRERVIIQTNANACMTCHGVINPLGFPLENYDAVGRFRKTDNNKPVDALGTYLSRKGEQVKFQGVKELGTYLAASEEVHAAFAEKLFHHLVQQPVRAYGPNKLEELRSSFTRNGFNIRKLTVEILVVASQPPKPATASAANPQP